VFTFCLNDALVSKLFSTAGKIKVLVECLEITAVKTFVHVTENVHSFVLCRYRTQYNEFNTCLPHVLLLVLSLCVPVSVSLHKN